jgi:O-antigen/teichoic acid export membrane protein
MATGASLMVGYKVLERLIGVLSTLVLARILVPEDFGLVALAMSVIMLVEILNTFGFDMALIQMPEPTRQHYDTTFTLNLSMAVAVIAVLLACAPLAATLLHEPRLQILLPLLGLASLVRGFDNPGIVDFRRELQFGKDFTLLMIRKVSAVAVTIPLALVLRNYWALVAGIVASNVIAAVLTYVMHPFRPRLCLQYSRDLLSYSKWIMLNNVLYFVRTKAGALVLGRYSGVHAVGVFSMAEEIATIPTAELVMPINRAVFPSYSRIVGNPDALRQAYLKVLGVVALFTVPAGAGVAATGAMLIPVLLGDKWFDAIRPLQIMAAYGVLMALQANSWSVQLARGKPNVTFGLSCIYLAVLLPLLVLLAPSRGATGAATAFLVAAAVSLPINIGFVLRELDISVSRVIGLTWRSVFAATVMYVGVQASIPYLSFGGGVVGLVLAVSLGAALYLAVTLVAWRLAGMPDGPETDLQSLLPPTLRAKLSPLIPSWLVPSSLPRR